MKLICINVPDMRTCAEAEAKKAAKASPAPFM